MKYPRCSLRRHSAYADAEVIAFDFMSKRFALPSCCYKSPIKTHVMVHEYCSKIREEKGNETQTLILLELGFVSHLSFALDFYLCMFRPSSKCLGDFC